MRYLALAADYDGTLARDGVVDAGTVRALERLCASGRKLILVTGRELDDLLALFPQIGLFSLVVAENGGVLFDPAANAIDTLAPAPEPLFVEGLRARAVTPLSVGRTIVATATPNETTVLEAIRDLGLELHVIFNKGAVMVLPAGVSKGSGLAAALGRLALSPHNVVAVGDAENDHSMLRLAELGAAVANAVPMLREAADLVLPHDHGAGVAALVEELIANDLAGTALPRHALLLGRRGDGDAVTIPPAGVSVLVAGSSGSGKSTLATGLLEGIAERAYQFCIIDPEGDYEALPQAILFGGPGRPPGVNEVLTALEKPDANVVVSLTGLPLGDRPQFFAGLLPRLQELRVATGRPHWILVDETHHLLPADWDLAPAVIAQALTGMLYVTVHPDSVAPAVLSGIDVVAALGDDPSDAVRRFATAVGEAAPPAPEHTVGPGRGLAWFRRSGEPPIAVELVQGELERARHRRKYAEGELPPDRSFYFRGPDDRLNLRAQNLILFAQLADGVDDATWLHHLRLGHYSTWIRDCIKSRELADEVQAVEARAALSAADSRRLVRDAIEQRFTLPAAPPRG